MTTKCKDRSLLAKFEHESDNRCSCLNVTKQSFKKCFTKTIYFERVKAAMDPNIQVDFFRNFYSLEI